MSVSYKDSGVDVERGYKAVELMKKHVARTYDGNVLGDLGSFGGFYGIGGFKYDDPVLVAGTDGVGTKLRYAFISGKHNTIGIDSVAMCVNDVICQGAKPLFFLDYFATGKIEPEVTATVVGGVAEGCVRSGCALIGGETAEMPSFYADGEYDLAGFSVGIVDKKKIINGGGIKVGDTLIGLASSGLHSNGYSLARKLFGEDVNELLKTDPRLPGTIMDALLEPTKIYVKTILTIISEFEIKGIAHITGGGFIENVPRIFPKGIGCKIDIGSYEKPPIYALVEERSGLPDRELYNTFNMGIGMVLAVDKSIAKPVVARLNALGESAYVIGRTTLGDGVTI